MKRLDSISKSPVFHHLSETFNGLPTIRAFAVQGRFRERNNALVDDNTRAFYTSNSINRWLGLRLDWMGATLVGSAAAAAVGTAGDVDPSLVGLSLR